MHSHSCLHYHTDVSKYFEQAVPAAAAENVDVWLYVTRFTRRLAFQQSNLSIFVCSPLQVATFLFTTKTTAHINISSFSSIGFNHSNRMYRYMCVNKVSILNSLSIFRRHFENALLAEKCNSFGWLHDHLKIKSLKEFIDVFSKHHSVPFSVLNTPLTAISFDHFKIDSICKCNIRNLSIECSH